MIERSRSSGRSKRVVKPPGGRSSDDADGAVKGEAHSAAAAAASGAGAASASPDLHIEVPNGGEKSYGSRGRGHGRGRGRKGAKGGGQPNFERNKHRKKGCAASPAGRPRPPRAPEPARSRVGVHLRRTARSSRADERRPLAPRRTDEGGGEEAAAEPPRCIFKNYNFTNDAPPETRYDFSAVPNTSADLADSALLRPSSRRQWFSCIQELESLAQESLDRRAQRLGVNTPSGLPLAYIADRMDIDDPLWGYQVRCAKTGWLQGFVTLTTFTTWTHFFEWNSTHPCSGMAAARVANSLVGKEDPALYTSEGGETVQQVASRVGQKASDIVSWNVGRYSNITINSRVQPGTSLYVLDPLSVDTMAIDRCAHPPPARAAAVAPPSRRPPFALPSSLPSALPSCLSFALRPPLSRPPADRRSPRALAVRARRPRSSPRGSASESRTCSSSTP